MACTTAPMLANLGAAQHLEETIMIRWTRAFIGIVAAVAWSGATLAQQETVRIAVLQSFSGITSLNGQQSEATIKLFMKKYGDTVGGKKIEYFTRDTTGPNPEVAKRLVQEAVTREKANILFGPDFTPNTIAAAALVTEAKVPMFVTGAATSGIVGERTPYAIRTFFSIPQLCRPMAAYAVKQGWKRVYVVAADYAPGHDCEKVYLGALAEAGGTSVGNVRIPLKNPEFSSYMQRIRDAKPDAVFFFMPIGEMSIGVVRAFNESGLKAAGIKLTGTGDITDETYLDATGDAAIGAITSGIYSTTHDSKLNKEFATEYVAMNGKSPRIGWLAVATWDAMRITYDALAAQAGQKFDTEKFMAFVKGRTFESPRGPVTIDKGNGDMVQNVYMRRTDKVNGVLQNIEIDTYKDQGFK